MKLKTAIKYFLTWRLSLVLFTIPAFFLIPLKKGFSLLSSGFSWDKLLILWSNFDGRSYLNLAEFGYGTPETKNDYILFPLYSYLIKNLNFSGSYLITALIISNLCFFLSIFLFYRLIRLDFSAKISRLGVILVLIFPTSFFLGAVYAESLFLFLSLACVYFARKENFFLASLFAAAASNTRLMGIFLLPFLAIEFWLAHKKKIRSIFSDFRLIFLLIPPLGLIDYLHFQSLKTGNALTFLMDKPGFSPNQAINKLILLYQVFFRYAKMLIFMEHTDPLFFTILLEFIVGLGFLLIIIFSFRYLRPSYSVYSLLVYLIPTLTGSFASLPRYVLIIFPAFILLASWLDRQPQKIKKIYFLINVLFTIIAVSLFSRGYFIS